MELEGKALCVPENAAAQLEQEPLADDGGLAGEGEREERGENRAGRVETGGAERGERIAVDECGESVVDAPRENRGTCHDSGLRENHHDGDKHDRTLFGREQLAQQRERALARGTVFFLRELVIFLFDCLAHCAPPFSSTASRIAVTSRLPVSVATRVRFRFPRASSSWFAIT